MQVHIELFFVVVVVYASSYVFFVDVQVAMIYCGKNGLLKMESEIE